MEARDFCFVRLVLRPLSLRFVCFFVFLSLRFAFASCRVFLRLLSLRLRCVRCVLSFAYVFARRLRKEKGEPRGGNDHGAFPLVLSGQMSAAGCTHDPRFPSG